MTTGVRLCGAALSLLAVACAERNIEPATGPPSDQLYTWLMSSPTARSVGDAAVNQSWLSEAPGRLPDLRAVMAATGTPSIAALDEILGPRTADVHLLLGALRQVRPGSTRGDLAHWVSVALMVLSDKAPDRERMPDNEWWDADYIRDLMNLREVVERGTLANAARPAMFVTGLPSPNLLFKPSRSVVTVARDSEATWPVFAGPAPIPTDLLAIAGTVAFDQDEAIEAADYRVAVRGAGLARARVDYVRTVAFHDIAADGQLEFASTGNFAIRTDQVLYVLAADAETQQLWVWLGDGQVASVPRDCCQILEEPDTLLWIQLGDGLQAGKWIAAPEDRFRSMPWAEYRAARIASGELTERPRSYPRLGTLGRTGSDRQEIAGVQLIFWRLGVAQGEPLFVLHGFPGLGSAYLRDPLAGALGTHWQLLFYDQRGSGYSEGADDPEELRIDRMVDDLERIRERSELEQIDLVGHAFGGLLALHYAIRYPDHVRSLVLIEPDPASHEEWRRFEAAIEARRTTDDRDEADRLEASLAVFPDANPAAMTALLGLRLRAYTVDPAHADQIDFALSAHLLSFWEDTRDAVRNSLGTWDLYKSVAAIRAPTLIVAGAQSPLSAAIERLHAAIDGSEFAVVDDAAHFPFVEAPARTGEIVSAFLRRVRRLTTQGS